MDKLPDLKYIRLAVGMLTTAFDAWIIVAVLLHSFGKIIPWYVWVLMGAEFLAAVVRSVQAKAKFDDAD